MGKTARSKLCWSFILSYVHNFAYLNVDDQSGTKLKMAIYYIGKNYALKKYDQFTLNTSCFWGSITPVVQFHEIFVAKIMNTLIYYYWLKQKFRENII